MLEVGIIATAACPHEVLRIATPAGGSGNGLGAVDEQSCRIFLGVDRYPPTHIYASETLSDADKRLC